MRVASIQLEIRDRPKREAVEYVVRLLERLEPCDLALLPEIWPTGYFNFGRYPEDAEPVDGPTVQRIGAIAASRRQYILMGSLVERDETGCLYNTSVLLGPDGGVAAKYRKIHLFGYQSEESRLLKRGSQPVVVDTPWGRIGLTTCYDLRFPELYRELVNLGATFFLVGAAWPEARVDAWRVFNQSRAIENLAFLFSCNCAGEPFAGHSMLVDPRGKVLAEAGRGEEVLVATVDPSEVAKFRSEFPALADRVFP